MLAKDRVFAIRAGTYTSSDIKEASFNYGYISGDAFKPGGTVAGSAKLTFTSIITSFNKLDKVYPEIGLKVGDSFEWVAMGEYFVNDINIDRNRNTTELDLIDGMFKLNQPYISDLNYPAQIRDVIREICVKTGVELETDDLGFRAIQHHIQSKADKKDITFREVLSQAIQLLGFSAFFNRKGKLEIRGLIESNITITADNYFLHGLTKSELMYQIAGITCKKDKETLTVGLRTGRSLELENNFMIQNILDDLYYDLKNIRYYPYSLDWQGHLKLDVGQWVTLKTNKNETFKVPVLSQSFNFKGGLKSKIGADSKAGNDTQYAYKGFLGKRIEQMSTEIEAEVQQQLEYKDKEFDEKINKVKSEINDGLEQSKAEAEAYADNIKQQIDGQLAESDRQYQLTQQAQDRQIAESLRIAGTSTNLANAARTLAEQAKVDLNLAKQSLSGQIALVSTQASQFFDASREETARQVAALRLAVTQDYVAKSVFEETARGISQRFESLYVGGTNLLTGTDEYTEIFNSEQSHAEFLPTPYDLAPVFDKYGLIEYTLSFDLRASQAGQVVVYQQNGSGSKYSGLWKPLTVTTEWQRFHVTFTPTEGTMSLANSYLAFYGTYGTGVKPIIRRVKIERGAIATDWSSAPEDQQSYTDTKIAEYRNAVDGRFANLQASVDSKANLVDFQTVKETAQLYERIIGSTETGIKDKVARMVMADSLFLTEVKDKISGTATQVSQLSNSWAVKNLTSAGTVLNQINLLANGTNRIDGRLTHITGQTLIDNGVINNAMIGELDAGKLTAGYISSNRFQADSITGDKLVMDSAFFNKFAANEAYLKQLFAKNAFITQVQAVNLSAKQIAGGIAKALNGGMDVNFDESKINFYTNVAAIRRIYTGHPTQFIKFETEGNYSRTIIGSNRNGGEVFNSATFAGIVVENTNNINTEDNVRVYGDNTLFRHAQGDVGWNINSVTQRIVPANINAESEIWSKHFVAPDKNSKPVRLDTAVAALWDIWNHIIYNNFEFNEALRTHIKARRDNWKFELNL
ncbi:tail fiber domain-containing protein [Streptococcus suis]|uniref:tail fiber domain-containing protein n=1 Tax=Streptococcus suis TaxID=1307 RepID=UPI003B27BC20